jgi:hypothetical protein
VKRNGLPELGDPPGEALTDRNPHALANLVLKTSGGRGDELPGMLIQ